MVGELEGESTGFIVGVLLGVFVGLFVGFFVGASVGLGVSIRYIYRETNKHSTVTHPFHKKEKVDKHLTQIEMLRDILRPRSFTTIPCIPTNPKEIHHST